MLKTGPWNLTDLKDIPKNGKTVFSCFHCGGGSTMGYKLSGFEVLGGVEIDPEMMAIYKANHNPKHSYLMGVQDFNKIPNEKLPKELFELDILDGSPPCSSFSMAGSREKAWGKNKKFREGQAHQVLDDLFFHFIDTANKLRPKIVVAENVKGLIQGKAKGYVKQIYQMFNMIGYDVQLFLLNAAFMGVPQRRERTFFIARRKDLNLPLIKLNFNEKPIFFGTIRSSKSEYEPTELRKFLLSKKKQSDLSINDINLRLYKKTSGFNALILHDNKICPTITATGINYRYFDEKPMSKSDILNVQTFPLDYNLLNNNPKYICGMSVPPYMMNRISDQIYKQWLKD